MSSEISLEFDHSVPVAEIPGGGLSLALEANTTERAALARRYGIEALLALAVSARLRPLGPRRYRLTGSFRARVRQTCVVTLEPLESDIADTFDVLFESQAAAPTRSEEVEIDAIGDDPPEPIENGRIPVGETVAQYLALAIDPFPRADDAVLETSSAGDGDAEAPRQSPFAILSKLG